MLKTSISNLNVFMGLMATLHERCLQVYICSRDGQIQIKKVNLKSLVPHFCENANANVSKICRRLLYELVDSVCVRLKNARVEKMPLNIRIQWNAGTACVSECVLKTLACRGLRVGPSKNETSYRNLPLDRAVGKISVRFGSARTKR